MRRHSLRFRLIALMIGLSTLPVVLITWVATTNTRRAVERELVGANVTRVNWAAGYLDELLRTLDALFYAVQIDPELAPLLTTLENDGPAESELARREIARLLSGSYYAHSRVVDEVQLYVRATGTAISVDNVSSGRIHSPDAAAGPWRGILDGPVPLLLQRVGDAIYAVHSINRFMDQSLRGAIAVRLDDGIEARIAGILASGGQDSIHVLNERGEPLISVSPGADADGRADSLSDLAAVVSALPPVTSSTTVRRTEDELVFARRVDRGRLTVAKRVPRWVIRRSARGTVTAGVLTGSAVAALSVVLAILFSLRISRPIVELAQSMEAATVPDFGKLNIQSRDEVKLLEDGYRSLMSQMKALAHREYLQEIELKDARLAALQAQINPHFLNNTLNLLGGMALAKGAQEVYKIARAVGDIFRYAVGGDGNLVTLDQEVNHVRNYLLIQEHRFAGRCELSVTSEPGALSARIPRFSLQPLVENAFEHGLQNKAGHWQLRLSCRRYRRGVLIVVRDNGVGMDRDTLVAVRNHLQDTDRSGTQGSSHIGLQNVNSRLRLHFGPRSGLRVRSTSGGGTTVAVVLPEQRGPS